MEAPGRVRGGSGMALCCRILHVRELDKPAHQWCEHCRPGRGGCSIYDRRPTSSRDSFASHGACGFGDGQHAATIGRQSPERGIVGALDAAFAISPPVPGLRTDATPSAFSIRMNRSSISSWMRSVFSWRCATSSSALMLTSYSMSDRTRSFADWRSWLISTKHDKKIASSDTIIVSRPNGNGSNGSNHGIGTTFIAIHTTNHTPLRMRNAMLPENAA